MTRVTTACLVSCAFIGLVACSSSSSRTGVSSGAAGGSDAAPTSSDIAMDVNDSGVTMTNGFTHPGILVSKGMLDFVKAKLLVGAEPWKDAFARASSDQLGKVAYTP